MKAQDSTLKFLADRTINKLVVPFFQRRYIWNKDNWEEMLHALQNKKTKPFLGSIILKEHENHKTTIIDGQQRLTTLTILTKAIYDSFEKEEREGSELKKYIESILFYSDNYLEPVKKGDVKIQHSKVDAEAYNYIINAGLFDVEDVDLGAISNESSLIKQCYKFFRTEFEKNTKEELLDLFNNLYFRNDEDKRFLVLITLNSCDINEQTIFDTINRAGVRLSTADIIKNNLFKRALELCDDEESKKSVIYYYDTYWENTFCQTSDLINMWDRERVFGNVKHSNLEFLLYCVATIKWGDSDDLFSNLEMVYENKTSTMKTPDVLQLIKDIKDYADIFKKYIEDFKDDLEDNQKSIYFGYNDSVRRLMLILQKFGVQMFYPYILKRLHDVNQDDSDPQLIKDFHILESFIVRRKISPSKHTNDYTGKCIEIIKNGAKSLIESDLQNDESGVSDSEVKMNLFSTKDESAKMILFMIELYRRKDGEYDFNEMEYKYTLEHIMPKSWNKNWSNVKILDNGVELAVDSDEGITYRKKMIQALGNKTLLTGIINSTVKNASFDIKIEGKGTQKGYRNHTELLLTKDVVNTYDSDNIWDEEHIINRTNELYNEFILLWPSFSDCFSTESNEEICFDDPEKMLNDVVSGFAFSPDREIINNNVSEFISFCNNKSRNIYAYKDLLLLYILKNGKDGIIDLSDLAKSFSDFYDRRRQKGLIVEGEESFIVKKYPYTISDLENEILAYPYERFARKAYMEYNSELRNISIVRTIWNQLTEQQISDLIIECENSISNHFSQIDLKI